MRLQVIPIGAAVRGAGRRRMILGHLLAGELGSASVKVNDLGLFRGRERTQSRSYRAPHELPPAGEMVAIEEVLAAAILRKA